MINKRCWNMQFSAEKDTCMKKITEKQMDLRKLSSVWGNIKHPWKKKQRKYGTFNWCIKMDTDVWLSYYKSLRNYIKGSCMYQHSTTFSSVGKKKCFRNCHHLNSALNKIVLWLVHQQ